MVQDRASSLNTYKAVISQLDTFYHYFGLQKWSFFNILWELEHAGISYLNIISLATINIIEYSAVYKMFKMEVSEGAGGGMLYIRLLTGALGLKISSVTHSAGIKR